MKSVVIRDLVIGEGMAKICAPVTGISEEEILEQSKAICALDADILEWRCDWYEEVLNSDQVKSILARLRKCIGDMALLVTFRTKKEGGQLEVDQGTYEAILMSVIESGYADMVDLEIMSDPQTVASVIHLAHERGMYVVASNHDFNGTPESEVLLGRMALMDKAGADILKIAVMPGKAKDVVRLLDVTEEASKFGRPVITMSMSGLGLVSRISGEVFGSAVTFGCVGRASAPGQIEVTELRKILELIHDNLCGCSSAKKTQKIVR